MVTSTRSGAGTCSRAARSLEELQLTEPSSERAVEVGLVPHETVCSVGLSGVMSAKNLSVSETVQFLCYAARSELGQEGVEATHDPRPMAAEVDVALGQEPQDLGVVSRFDTAQARSPLRISDVGEDSSLRLPPVLDQT